MTRGFGLDDLVSPRNARVISFCVTAAIAIVFFATGVNTVLTTQAQTQSATTTVEATVVHSEVIRDSGGRRGGVSYYLNVTYEYEYNEQRYTSDNIYSGDVAKAFDSREDAEEVAADFRENSTVTAYVTPDTPSSSYLVRPSSETVVSQSLFAFLLAVPFLYISLKHLRVIVHDLRVPGPDKVTLDRSVVQGRLRDGFEEIEEYPITETEEVTESSVSEFVDLQEFKLDVRTLDRLVESDPATPCDSPEELAEFFVREMDQQGYFSSGPAAQ